MRYARIGGTARIVEASQVEARHAFACPSCGGRVFLRAGDFREPHFAHFSDDHPDDCDQYYPGTGSGTALGSGRGSGSSTQEDLDEELALVVEPGEGDWALALRLPTTPREEFSGSLAALQSCSIDVFAGDDRVRRVPGLEVRPASSTARAVVPPTSREYRTEPAGTWPKTINAERWSGSARGLSHLGTLFRLRAGEWGRLSRGSAVRWGDRLVVVAHERCPPPPECSPAPGDIISTSTGRWGLWRAELPASPSTKISEWLERLGHPVAPPRWRLSLLTVPRSFDQTNRTARFFVGERVLLRVIAPDTAATALLRVRVAEHDAQVTLRSTCAGVVAVTSAVVGQATAMVTAEGWPQIEFAFIEPRDVAGLREELRRLPRLRVWLDECCLQPWGPPFGLKRTAGRCPSVRVEPGVEGAKVTVVVVAGTARTVASRLSAAEAASRLVDAIGDPRSEQVVVDAGGLGTVTIELQRALAPSSLAPSNASPDRRSGWIHSASLRATAEVSGAFVVRALKQRPALLQVAVLGGSRATMTQLRAIARAGWTSRGRRSE